MAWNVLERGGRRARANAHLPARCGLAGPSSASESADGGGGGVAVRQQDGLGVHMGKPRIKVELYTLWLLRSRFPGKCPSPFE